MPHAVESMFFAGEVPWHGLGKSVEQEVTAKEAIVAAGLDWKVALEDIYAASNDGITQNLITTHKAVVRQSDRSVLSVVGNRYRPFQNEDKFSFFDHAVGEGKAIYHTAGSLHGGRKVWILAKLPGEIIVGNGDVTHKYLCLSDTFDESGTLRVFFTPVRVVCANTLNMALVQGMGQGISIRHTASAEAKLEAAKNAIESATEFYDAFNNHAMLMAGTKFSEEQMKALVERLFPNPEDAEEGEVTAASKKRDAVVELFTTGMGHDKIQGTAWAAMNAVSEYTDHHMKMNNPSQDKKLERVWFGKSANLKQVAYDTIMEQIAA